MTSCTTTIIALVPNCQQKQLIEFTEDILRGMKEGKQSDVVVVDFANAFDKVCHTRLLHKLHMYGIDPETGRWSRSFLCGRIQCVVVDGEASEELGGNHL